MGQVRLDRLVSHLIGLSRKDASKFIKEGQVKVADETIFDPAFKVSDSQSVVIDDLETQVSDIYKKRYFMVNKPQGCICADKDRNLPVVVDLLQDELNLESLHCAGRLDLDTTGLLIVTDDGDLNHKITSPKKEISKTYLARTNLKIEESLIERFAQGLKHPKEVKRYKSAHLEILEENLGKVTVSEGRYHEVKRLFELCGLEVIELKRIAIGKLNLDETLDEGEYRPLEESELQLLFA